MKKAIRFLQVEFNGMAPGTLMVPAEPTTAHLQARAMVGTPIPGTYHRAIGDDEVHWVPTFENILGVHHPQDPRRNAPAYITDIYFGVDTLPGGKAITWDSDRTNWPECRLVICINPECKLEERYNELILAMKEIEESSSVIVPKQLLQDKFREELDQLSDSMVS